MPAPRTPRPAKASNKAPFSSLPTNETNGALPTGPKPSTATAQPPSPSLDVNSIVARTIGGAKGGKTPTHQTHGAVTPLTGPITSVSQLTGRLSVSKGSMASFGTLQEYTTHLKTLSLGDLHRHAIEDARIVPIDDRDRLIRRLEGEWTTTASRRAPAHTANGFTQEQVDAQDAIRRKLLHR